MHLHTISTILLALLLPLLTSSPAVSEAHPVRSGSSRVLIHSASGGAGGLAAGQEGGSTAKCTFTFRNEALSFPNCLNLDPSGNFVLAWKLKAGDSTGSSTVTVFFQGAPQNPYGWSGWGISPSPAGFMPGSDAIVGYGNAVNTSQSGAGTYHMEGTNPRLLAPPVDSRNLLLPAVNGSIQVEIADSGNKVRILADVAGVASLRSATVIWRGGPSADVSTGELSAHRDYSGWKASVDFLGGGGETEGAGGTRNQMQKTVHAFLSAIGFGVLLPLGILISRHMKLWLDPIWFYCHVATQITGYVVGAAGWGIGIWLKTQFGDISLASETQKAHFGVGVAVFCCATLQILTPVLKPAKGAPTRMHWNVVHWFLGYATVLLAFVNIFLGFEVLAGQGVGYRTWMIVFIVWGVCFWGILFTILECVSWHKHLSLTKLTLEAERLPKAPT